MLLEEHRGISMENSFAVCCGLENYPEPANLQYAHCPDKDMETIPLTQELSIHLLLDPPTLKTGSQSRALTLTHWELLS